MPKWTDQETQRLRQLKADRVKLPAIEKELNKTRGQICGKWNRIKGYVVPKEKKDVRGSKAPRSWTEESLTERWADRQRKRSSEEIRADLEGSWSDA